MINDNTPAWGDAPAMRDRHGYIWTCCGDGYRNCVTDAEATAAELEAEHGPCVGLWPQGEKPVEAEPDTSTATWRQGDDDAAWEAVKALLVEGATVTVERTMPTYTATITGAVTGGGDGDLYIGVGGGAITTYGLRRNTITSITVTAPDPKAALAKQLEADGWAWRPACNGSYGYTYRLVSGEWGADGSPDASQRTTAELLEAFDLITRHPAFVAGEAKGATDE